VQPKATVVIRRYVVAPTNVLIVVVLAVLSTRTVALVIYAVRTAFQKLKLSVLKNVLIRIVTTTTTALGVGNVVVVVSVLVSHRVR
jgi:hypothetical protein